LRKVSDVEEEIRQEQERANGWFLMCMSIFRRHLKPGISTVLVSLSMATFVMAQSIATRGPTPPPEFKKAVDRFNRDVTAWNTRCKVTRFEAEEAWCKKERTRIDARRAELIALGAIPKR
jgi:hypothetical protein